ncbi:hypothetical protein B0O79_1485 [Flavobacteriaceae bacterium MAR_2009_75]|nr:hypothetical protein B0O79_1485 [Flavobacteriaceae bacterium MAR_2009_75]
MFLDEKIIQRAKRIFPPLKKAVLVEDYKYVPNGKYFAALD